MTNAQVIMVQGTHSDAGKSVIATALCRIFHQKGYRTAPFKSQNMSLNSYITADGKEIGRAQGVQAEAAGVEATTDMNPILIKPSRDTESQIVVHGKPFRNMKAGEYRHDFFQQGLALIGESLEKLSRDYERIVIEGAGSPAEVNLNDRELVNMRVARLANAPVVLVGDIDKGGVFASLVGTLQLLEPQDRDRVIGVVINKFRGDVSLLQPGLDWFEDYTGKPVLGVVPYVPNLTIDAEDSLILDQYSAKQHGEKTVDVAVIRYPKISNFTDADPFSAEPDCHVRYVTQAHQLGEPDIVLLPGSKNTVEDLQFLKKSGLFDRIAKLKKTVVIGICGGYQMLGEWVEDPFAVESPHQKETGLGLIPVRTVLAKEKRTVRSRGMLTLDAQSFPVDGYEIHMGQTTESAPCDGLIELEDGTLDGRISPGGRVMGTYFHGVFHNDAFRWALLNRIRTENGMAAVRERPSFHRLREDAYNQLADHVAKHVDLDRIEREMARFSE